MDSPIKKNIFKTLNELMQKIIKLVWSLDLLINYYFIHKELKVIFTPTLHPRNDKYRGPLFSIIFFSYSL